MSPPVVTFFNNKGGVGKTALVYHLAWMVARKGRTVIAADLDPQANLTANFFDDEQLEQLWPADDSGDDAPARTIFGSLRPMIRGIGDIADPPLLPVADQLWVLPGDLALSRFEDELSGQWPACVDGSERAFRVVSAFWRLLMQAAQKVEAGVILTDVGPNLGAINRSAMVATDHVVIPLSPDLFSVQGLRNLGPTLRRWRREWQDRLAKNPDPSLRLPAGGMSPAGYVCSALAYGWAGRSRRTSVGWPAYPACTGPPCSEWRARPPDRPGSVLSGPTQALPKPPAAGVRGAQADLPAHARGQGFRRSPGRRRRGQQRLLRPGRPATERGGSRAPRRRAVPLGSPSSSSTPRQTAR